jgi:hypothetical protein
VVIRICERRLKRIPSLGRVIASAPKLDEALPSGAPLNSIHTG